MKKTTYLILISILCSYSLESCKGNSQKETDSAFNNVYALEPVKDKVIKLDSNTSVDRIRTFYYKDSKSSNELFYLLNKLNLSIQVYDWRSGLLTKTFKLQKEGPNGVGNVEQFSVIRPDSLCLLSSYDFKLFIVNNLSKVLKRFNLIIGENGRKKSGVGVHPLGSYTSPIGQIDERIFIGGYPFAPYESKVFYENGHIGMSINKHTGTLDYVFKMPDSFLEDYKKGYRMPAAHIPLIGQTYNRNKKTIIINIPADSFIYEINVNNNKVNKYYAGSTQYKKIELVKVQLNDTRKEFEHYIQAGHYSELYYDPYRDIYLRIIEEPNPDKKDGFDGKSWTKLSVIILNSNFRKMGEQKLGDEYRSGKMIFTEDGIFIKKYKDTESELVYTQFKLLKK